MQKKKSSFEKFAHALYSTSVSMPLNGNILVWNVCDAVNDTN